MEPLRRAVASAKSSISPHVAGTSLEGREELVLASGSALFAVSAVAIGVAAARSRKNRHNKPKPEKAAGGSDFKAPQSDQALISQLRAAQAEAAGLRGQLQEQEEETQQRVSAAEAAAMAAQEELWHMSAEQRTAEESAAAVDALVARARSQLVEGLLHCDSEEQQEPATPQHPPLPQSSSGGALHAWGSGAGEELVAFSERRARAAGSDQASAMGPLAAGRVASKLKVGSSSRPSTSDGSSDAGLPADRAAAPAHALVLMAAREGEGAGEDDEAQAARLAEALQQLERMRLEKEQLAAAAARREQALAAAEARLAASNATVARMQALAQALGGIKHIEVPAPSADSKMQRDMV